MSLTIETHDVHSEVAEESLNVERWLDVMHGIRPGTSLRATFVPIAYEHSGDVAEWLETMWGIGASRSFSTATDLRGPAGSAAPRP